MTELEQAIKYIESNEVEKGLKLINEIKDVVADDEKLLILEYFQQWGLIDEALAMADKLLELYPNEAELLVIKAELYIDVEQEEKALETLEKISHSHPVYAQALLLMADLYEMQGLPEVAEAKLLNAKELLPDEPVIDFALGEFFLSQGEFKNAQKYYKKLLKIEEDFNGTNLHHRLAESLSGLGQFEEALPHYEKALENKLEINILFEYGVTAYQAGQHTTAIARLTELKELDPQYHSVYLPLAKAYEQEEMLAEALQTAKEGIKDDEFNKELWFYSGKIALKLQNEEWAEKAFREALALDPGYLEALLTLAKLLLHQERFEDVIEHYEHAKEFGEDDPHFEWDLAKAYEGAEEYKKALNAYEAAYSFFKEDILFLEDYGMFLMEEGKRREARTMFEKILSINPSATDIQEILWQLEDL
ncbi:tetratricopeptide repeat protein [Priestia endophytica]|jgi:tetratricopeptide (TPR) repeat protein|uniref:tetratricopeptide repeat protein n=1 Tax=Priestia endophytica TaxID=135735 RepID=UPI000F521C1B|nr:tetratricopeptide repeat protein [Priestia endophytica]MED4070350.1 tetratricopeptide repeat protein [Priestia endophytica]RPK15530.1 hypothetical protein FH5_00965 [Priestia endophytica]